MHGTISRVERRYLLMRESNQGAVAAGLLFICLLAVGVYSCAVNPVTGRSELALISFSEEEEAALGAKAYTPAVQQQGGFYRDRELEAYVQDVGMRLARGSHRPHLNYRYRVLNSSVPNAFALPGGYIVINRGRLVGLSSEAEAAAVLGHETGHVTAKHSLAGFQRALAANVLVTGIVVAAGGGAGVQELSGITASLLENGFSRDPGGGGGVQPGRRRAAAGIFLPSVGGGEEPLVPRGTLPHPPVLEGAAGQRPRPDRAAVPGNGQTPEFHFQRNDLPSEDRAPAGGAEGVRDRGRGGQAVQGETVRRGAGEVPWGRPEGTGAGAVPFLGRKGRPGPEGARGRGN